MIWKNYSFCEHHQLRACESRMIRTRVTAVMRKGTGVTNETTIAVK